MKLIDEQGELDGVLPLLEETGRIAIDTEADSMHCYFEKLCLIQMSVPGHDLLLDPLSQISYTAFFQSLAGKEIILHGADYDLRLLRRAGFPLPVKVFDTMIAARLAGRKEFSLSSLIKEFFAIELAKGSQKANWAQRPLSPKMLEYAINDTRYLRELADRLESELRSLGRLDWHRQSCEQAVDRAQITRERDPEKLWQISGSRRLNSKASAVLRALWLWRDSEARRADRPAFHILHNEQLLEAATRIAEGNGVAYPRMSSSRSRRFAAAVEEAKDLPDIVWPVSERKPRLRASKEQVTLLEQYKRHRDRAASELQIDPSLIAPKAILEKLVFDPETALADMLPWQRQLMDL